MSIEVLFIYSYCVLGGNQANHTSIKSPGTAGGVKSQHTAIAAPSPAPSPAGTPQAASPANPVAAETPKASGGDKSKKSVEKPQTKEDDKKDDEGKDKEKEKEKEEDSFDKLKPVAREAKRAEEVSLWLEYCPYRYPFQIKKHGPVDQKRKDYKTLRNDILSSDFDKSLGLPNIEEKQDEKK